MDIEINVFVSGTENRQRATSTWVNLFKEIQ